MAKKAHITVNLLPEASEASTIQIEERIRNEAKIPWCKNIERVLVDNTESSYMKLRSHGISSNVARNLVNLYT